jgi:hypothetical protein
MTSGRPTPGGQGLTEVRLLVMLYAACSDSGLDPDLWFPVSQDPATARREAAAALMLCAACVVRTHCLELALRHWPAGQHGIWGGTLPSERQALRERLTAHARQADHLVPRVPGF